MELGMFTFSMFKDSFGIFVMFVNMGMRDITLIKSESAVYEFPGVIFIELLNF